MNKILSSILVFVLLGGNLFIFLPTIPNARALRSWAQTTDTDFSGGTLDNLRINGTGTDARLELIEVDSWTNKSPAEQPAARRFHGMTTIYSDDKVLLFGGYNEVSVLVDTWVYDLSDNKWTNKNPIPKPSARGTHAMASIFNDDKVVLFGGVDGSLVVYNDTWIYDLSTNTWTNKNPEIKPPARALHSMAPIYNDDKVVLFSGYNGATYIDDTWEYDLSTNTWTNKNLDTRPSVRCGHAMASIFNDDKVVLFGGNDGALDDETWVYDLSDNNWTNKHPATKPSAREGHAMTTVYNDDKVVLFGGYDGTFDDETWVYDLSDNQWTKKQMITKPLAREFHAMATIYNDDKVVLFGGIDPVGLNDETWVYELIGYSPLGTFISAGHDTGASSSFKKIYWNATLPLETSLELQIRTASTKSGLLLENFVGPDGTVNTYYTTSGSSIWSGHNSDRWLQYRLSLYTTNSSKTPVLSDVTLTYNLIPLPPTPTAPANAQWLNNSKPTFSWVLDDPDGGLQSAFSVQIDDDINFGSVDYTSGEVSSSASSWTPSNPISDGIWYWRVKTKDNDNDWSDYNSNKNLWLLKIDTIAPLTNHSISGKIGENGWYTSSVQITLLATDETSGVGETRYQTDAGDWGIYTAPFIISGEGEHTVSYYSKDNAGNEEIKRRSVIKIDTIAPHLNVTEPLNGTITNKKEIYINGTTEANATVAADSVKVEVIDFKFSCKINLTEGDNIIEISTYDEANNKNTSIIHIILDTTQPTLEIVSLPDITNQIELKIEGRTEDGADVYINDEKINVSNERFSVTISLTEGENNITIESKDVAGNTKIIEKKIILDTTLPSIEIIEPKKSKTKESKMNIKGKTEHGTMVYINDENIGVNDEGEFSYNIDLAKGKNTIMIRAIDSAGNERIVSLSITREPEVGLLSQGNIWFIVSLVLLMLIFSVAYALRKKIIQKTKEKKPEPIPVERKEKRKFAIEDFFLLYRDGRLIWHTTQRLKADINEETLACMLNAVQMFVKDSLAKKGGVEHSSMDYGAYKILFEGGKSTILVAVIHGEEPIGLREEMKNTINNVEAEYSAVLVNWDGIKTRLAGAEKFLMQLGEYKVVEERIEAAVDIMGELEFYQGYVRLKVGVKNNMKHVVTNVIFRIIYAEEILRLEYIEPKYETVGNEIILGNIEPKEKKAVAFYLDPQICTETYVEGVLTYKDAEGNLHTTVMKRKKAAVVCPVMYTMENINTAMLKRMINEELGQKDSKIFKIPLGISSEDAFNIGKRAAQHHDVRFVREFIKENTSEAWYYGKLKERVEKVVVKVSVRRDTNTIEFLVASESALVVVGLLAELKNDISKELQMEGKRDKIERVLDLKIVEEVKKTRPLLDMYL
ncbi:MAG: kelch repeat-containing protein [Candidatus Thermoplasmatota archaeon]